MDKMVRVRFRRSHVIPIRPVAGLSAQEIATMIISSNPSKENLLREEDGCLLLEQFCQSVMELKVDTDYQKTLEWIYGGQIIQILS